MNIQPSIWKHGKRWAYTVTYDEAMSELFDHVVPLHEELGIPGHLEVVVGHIGKVRAIGNSSYNGYTHMPADQLRQLIDRGWGVGNHSWTHGVVDDNIDLEIYQAKTVLEEAIGRRVTSYCAPGSNDNMTPTIFAALEDAGYLCAMSVTDDINTPDGDLWFLNRASNLHKAWTPLFSAFDPFHRLHQAAAKQGWVIDYCHCPSPQIPHESKDVYIDEHRARLETMLSVGGNEVWPATAEEIVDYMLCRRHTRIEPVSGAGDAVQLTLVDLPTPVMSRQVTFDLVVPPELRRNPVLKVNGQAQPATLISLTTARVTLDLSQPVVVSLEGSSQ